MKKEIHGRVDVSGCIGSCSMHDDAPPAHITKATFEKFAAQAQKIAPYNPDMQYLRFRAIGNLEIDGPNNNWDGFPYEDFEDEREGFGYSSFIGKHAFVEHQSHSVDNAIGTLPGAYLNRFIIPEKFGNRKYADLDSWSERERQEVLSLSNQRDGSIEVLMGIHKDLAPRIAKMVDAGQHLSCSMGTNIDHSICTVCGNIAHFEHQYCQHIYGAKGSTHLVQASDMIELVHEMKRLRPEWLPKILASQQDVDYVLQKKGNKMVRARAYEVNRELGFFELSVVANPAYFKGQLLERVASLSDGGLTPIDISKMSNAEIIALAFQHGLLKLSELTNEELERIGEEVGLL